MDVSKIKTRTFPCDPLTGCPVDTTHIVPSDGEHVPVGPGTYRIVGSEDEIVVNEPGAWQVMTAPVGNHKLIVNVHGVPTWVDQYQYDRLFKREEE